MIRRIRAVALRVIEQFRHDRRSLALILVVPLVILTLLGYLLRPSGGTSAEPVAVVNEDRGAAGPLGTSVALGGVVAEALAAAPSLAARRLTAADADAALRDGSVNAVVTVPATFTADVLQSQRLVLAVKLEGSDPFITTNTAAAIQKASLEAIGGAVSRLPLGAPPRLSLDVSYLYGGADYSTLDYFAPVLIPFLAFFFVFLLTDVAFIRERSSGTLERLLATPLRRGELVAGYVVGLSFFAIIQTLIVIAFSIWVLNVRYRGNVGTIFLVELVMVLGAVNLGLFLSAFARNEFQAVQFIPLVILPQAFLAGIFIPIADLPELLRPVAFVLPLTYANDALRAVMVKGFGVADPIVLRDLAALAAFAVLAAIAATSTIRREVA
jgi:ABC-2 type transport system permease protein